MIALFLAPFLALTAQATTGFDPLNPAARYTDTHTYTLDGTTRIWSAIERLEDPDRTLFHAEDFNDLSQWKDADPFAPYVLDAFGGARPGSWSALLHMGPAEEVGEGTPILFVPGAGDNASRGFVTMATKMDREWRPVYALTFAHPHGDVFLHAEMIANAIARIKARTGATQVDIVSHSKGGIATAVYLSSEAGVDWGHDAYESVGTTYRGDVRRAVFIAAPLDGIDTAWRWPSANYASLETDLAIAPTSWNTYYPYTTVNLLVSQDLTSQDFLAEGDADLFPGHRQLLRSQDHPLPGSLPWLGTYMMQQDWFTTYEGGLGYYSHSDGIDAAIEDGGFLLDELQAQGVHPDIEIFVLAGENPLMPSAAGDFAASYFDETFTEMAQESATTWGDFIANVVGDGLLAVDISEAEVAGIASGKLVLGEISGPSDGVVFASSATHTEMLTARGAEVVEVKIVNLSHMDMLYASPITGQALIDLADEAPENAYMRPYGERYIEADTLGWLVEVLADSEGDTGDTGDTGTMGDMGDTGEPVDKDDLLGGQGQGCESCNGTGSTPTSLAALLPFLLLLARRRS